MDTSVILSPYYQGDPYRTESLAISSSRKHAKVTSHIGLIELASVISRLRAQEEIKLPEEVELALSSLDFSRQVHTILLFMLRHANMRVLVPNTIVTLQLEEQKIRLSSLFVETFNLAPRSGLRTLDNLHLASLASLKMERYPIDYMVTSDQELLKARRLIAELTGTPVTSPRNFVDLELT